MYSNIGEKIKKSSLFFAIIGSIAGIVVGTGFISQGNDYNNEIWQTAGWAFAIGGPLMSWILSLVLYGFGELVEKAQALHAVETVKNNTTISTGDPIQPRHGIGYRQQNTWTCSCGHVNSAANGYCERCGKH
jgi:hypothetical protein